MILINNRQLNIRKCRPDDYLFCHSISRRAMESYFDKYFGGWNSQIYKKNFKPAQIAIIEYKQHRIGLYAREIIGKQLYILNIQVSGNFRNKGIGFFILKKLENEAIKKKLTKMSLQVFKDNPAIILYKKTGFKKIKIKNHSVLMEKNF